MYVDGAKIASLGLRIRNHATYHGLSLNGGHGPHPVQLDQPVRLQRPARHATSELGVTLDVNAVAERLLPHLRRATGGALTRPPHWRQHETDNTQGVKAQGGSKTARIPIKSGAAGRTAEKPSWIRVKSRLARAFRHEIKDIPAPAKAAHRSVKKPAARTSANALAAAPPPS